MKSYIKNFMKYRYLLAELIKKDIVLKYRRSYLGILWTLLEPLLTMIVLTVVFGTLFGRTDKTFPVYVLSGRLLYTFFSGSTKAAMKSIRTHSGMIKKVYVPKYIYPLASILSNYVIFLISLIVLVVVAAVLKIHPTIYLLQAVIPLIIIVFMTLGVGLILCTLSVFFRDLEYLWSVALMLIMYTSAIFYPAERLVKSNYGWLLDMNPLYSVILNFRNAIYGQMLDTRALILSVGFSAVVLVIGIAMFLKNQDKFILHV